MISRPSLLAHLAAFALVTGTPAQAAERFVDDLAQADAYAPAWQSGAVWKQRSEEGLSWLQVTTAGKGEGHYLLRQRPLTPPLDLRGRFLKVRLKVDDIAHLGGTEFRLSSDGGKSFFAFGPRLYADPDFNIVRSGSWATLTFSLASARTEGEPDPSAIDTIGWWVADSGKGTPLTASWAGITSVDAPERGVATLTFDDGYDEHYEAAKRMARHGFAGTAYVIPNAIGEPGYLTLDQIREMHDRFGWDIAAHHETPFTDMSRTRLETVVLGIQHYLAAHGFGRGAGHLAYPLGKQDIELVRPVVRRNFETARVAGDGPETLPPADPHLLRTMNVLNTTPPSQIGEAARSARASGDWLILMFHYLVEERADGPLEYRIEDFDAALRAIRDAGIDVVPLTKVWERCARRTGPWATGPACDPTREP